MLQKNQFYQLVVCGGGLAGFCAAVSAARLGVKTCLVQNRPVFGGNSSSEVRVTPHGAAAFHAYARETGILSELLIEERATNHETIFENGWTNSVWDLTLYNAAMQTPNLTFYVNTDVFAVQMKGKRQLEAVIGRVLNAETELTLHGEVFIDCTGDGIVADLAGCEWRLGTESRHEFGEPHAPEKASSDVMGNSIHFKTRNVGRPVPFKAPDWAMHYEDAGFFYEQGRLPKDERGGFWWLEIGVPYHTIHQAEDIRHELTRHALGVWDWMKNKDSRMKELTANYALDWIGQVPGKRESRRVMGQYLMTEHDPQQRTIFPDEIAFGGWFIDLHTPGGLLARDSEPASGEDYNTFTDYAVKSYAGPYGIPLRILLSKDVDNLMMAGRNVSVTHAALGTVRVMATTALMGQAAGTAAAVAFKRQIPVAQVPEKAIGPVQQQLLRDGCFLPNYKNEDPLDLARQARVTASSQCLQFGAGPESKGSHEGLRFWKDQPQYLSERLENRRGQLIAVGSQRIDTLEVCLTNLSGKKQPVKAQLSAVEHIWDYRCDSLEVLASTTLAVAPGKAQWIPWEVNLQNLPNGRFVRLDVLPNTEVEWLIAGRIEPGHLASYQIGPDKMRRFGNGHTLSFRVSPAQACYGPQNVISGVTRPLQYTNLWKSDPNQPLMQWLELSWDTKQSIGQVELTFPGHLLREYHAYEPFYRDPQCPKDYSVAAWLEGEWRTVLEVQDNYHRHRKHLLPQPVHTTALRIRVHTTNGDPSAQIYEVRCYS
jgi:hypothetical protein